MKAIRFFSTLLLICTFSLNAFAHSPKMHIEMEPGFFSRPQLFVNGREVQASSWTFGYADLAEAVKDNPKAFEYAEKYETYSTVASACLWGGLGGAIGYLMVSRPDFNPTVYWGIFLTGLLTSAGFQQAASSYFFKTMNTYNGVDSNKRAQLDMYLAPSHDGATMGLTLAF